MMFRRSVPLLLTSFLLALFAPIARADRGDVRVAFEGRTIDDMIGEFMEEQRIPGMTLAIVQAPYISRVAGYGVATSSRDCWRPRTRCGTSDR